METFILDIISLSIFAPLSKTVLNEDKAEWTVMHLQTNT